MVSQSFTHVLSRRSTRVMMQTGRGRICGYLWAGALQLESILKESTPRGRVCPGDCGGQPEMLLQSVFGFLPPSGKNLSSSRFVFSLLMHLRKVLAGLHPCQRHSGSLWARPWAAHGDIWQTGSAGVLETFSPTFPWGLPYGNLGEEPKPRWMGWHCPTSPPTGFPRTGAEGDRTGRGPSAFKPKACNKRFPVKSHLLPFICRLESFWHCFIYKQIYRFANFFLL